MRERAQGCELTGGGTTQHPCSAAVPSVGRPRSPAWRRGGEAAAERGRRRRRGAEEWGAGRGGGAGEEDTAPEGNTLCFAVACVDRNQMVRWNTRLLGRRRSQTYG